MPEQLRNLLITLTFDGTAYHGFQVQKNAVSICEVFQNAVESVLKSRWDIKGCSRTDAGVHATKYCISMIVDHPIPNYGLLLALNCALPDDIAIVSVQEVPLEFHARYHAIAKEYTYLVHNNRIKDPFSSKRKHHFTWNINADVLNQEAQVLVGKHDFSAFCARAEQVEDPVRTVESISVDRFGDEVRIKIKGDGFLYNMVRIIVGTLLSISSGKIKIGEIEKILESKDRLKAGDTAPAHGLYLTDVIYPEHFNLEESNENSC